MYFYQIFCNRHGQFSISVLKYYLKNLFSGCFQVLFFPIQTVFLSLSKNTFQFFGLCFFYIHQFHKVLNVQREEKQLRSENKNACCYVEKITLSDHVGSHFSFFNGNSHNVFFVHLWFLIGFKIYQWFNSFSVVFVLHALRTFFNSIMLFIAGLTFKIFEIFFWINSQGHT